MENKKNLITLTKRDLNNKFQLPKNKRLNQSQSSRKIPINLTSITQNKHLMPTDFESMSTRQTYDSSFNNKKNNSKKNFIYKKNMNRPKISIKVIKNQKYNNNLRTELDRKTLAHSSSTGIVNNFEKNNNNAYHKNYENNDDNINNSFFKMKSNGYWVHSPEKSHKNLFTQNFKDLHFNNFKEKIKNINISALENLKYKENSNNISNINYNINSYKHKYRVGSLSPKKKNKKSEIINIEDLLLLDENFNEVINSIPHNFNISNNCFEFINIYVNSSLNCNFEKYFTDYNSKIITHISIMIMIFNIIITYHISFSPSFLSSCNNFLKNLIILSHKSFLLICNLISRVVSSSEQENMWVKKLRKTLQKSITHVNQSDEEFMAFLSLKNLKLENDIKVDSLIEIKFYSFQIKKYIRLLLNMMNDKDLLKNDFCDIFKNIDNCSFNDLNKFYISKVLRIINKNASVTGKNASSYGALAFSNIKVPYLSNPTNKKFTLVLDLDETLIAFKISSNLENKGLLRFRPGLDYFLLKMKSLYEIVVFTSATKEYADPIIDSIEAEEKYFDARLYRHHTIIYENDFVKDISRIGRPMNSIIIVDNMPQNFRLQKENGIFIKPFWGDDIFDTAIFSLADILEKIHNQFSDVRQGIFYFKDELLNKVASNFSKKENI